MTGGVESGVVEMTLPPALSFTASARARGKRKTKLTGGSGRYVTAVPLDDAHRTLAIDATLRKAALRTFREQLPGIRREDLMAKLRAVRGGSSILFVVDASGSMGVEALMAKTKGLVLGLLSSAYQKRERVGMVTFRGTRAETVLPFTRSVMTAMEHLRTLRTGGKTPLSEAVATAIAEFATERKKHPRNDLVAIFFTDGKANISRGGGDPFDEAIGLTTKLREMRVTSFVVDTEPNWFYYPYAKDLAKALKAGYYKLADIMDGNIRELISR